MLDAIAMKFKNKTEADQQLNAYKSGQKSLKVFGEVGPYYVTWLLLTMFRIDREYSGNVLMVMCLLVAVFEVQVRLNYGSGTFEFLIRLMYNYFPAEFTVG
jgi:hypothetical protein